VTLQDEIAETEAKLAALKQRAATATCAEAGHRWKSVGGANAGCELGDECDCSVAVRECEVCGVCDYGESDRPKVHEYCRKRHDALSSETI